jgi:hypothetical protein
LVYSCFAPVVSLVFSTLYSSRCFTHLSWASRFSFVVVTEVGIRLVLWVHVVDMFDELDVRRKLLYVCLYSAVSLVYLLCCLPVCLSHRSCLFVVTGIGVHLVSSVESCWHIR